MFVISTIMAIGGPIEDLTRPEYASLRSQASLLVNSEGVDVEMNGASETDSSILSKMEEDELLRDNTRFFSDWIINFFKAVFNLLGNLPEPGKYGKVGGKAEDAMTASINSMCDYVVNMLAPKLFDEALRIFYEFAANSPRANSAKITASIAACFARADAAKTLALFFPLCDRHIRLELENGASSSPSTSSAQYMEEDTAFQYYAMLLAGAMASGGNHILRHQDALISLLSYMRQQCRSERGYSHLGRTLAQILTSLTSIYPEDAYHYVNGGEWSSPGEHIQTYCVLVI